MSTKSPNNNSSDEVDLGHLFNAIGRLIERFFKFIGSIFVAIFSLFIAFLKIIVENIIIISVVVGAAFIIGYFTENYKKPVYEASMLVRPYFDSKYQLMSSIDYYNSLLQEKRFDALADIFKISTKEAQTLKRFDVEKGPETKNDLLRQYDEYLKTLDSTRAKRVTYDNFVENRDIYSSELFVIKAKSHQRDIFRKLEGSIDSIFANRYSIEQKKKRDIILDIKRGMFEQDLESMDSLKGVYLNVIQKEAERGTASISVQGLLPLQQEKSITKEYEVFQFEIRTRDSIKALEQLKVEESNYYEVLSRFPEVGKNASKLYTKNWFIFPIFAFLGLCVIYILISTYKFVKRHD